MVSENTFITILVISAFVIAFLAIYFVHHKFKNKVNLIKGFIFITLLLCGAGYFTKTDVYTFKQTTSNTDYTKHVVLYSTDISLPNGKTITVSPVFGIDKSIVVNLMKKPLYFETINYGSTNERLVRQKLPAYQATKVNAAIDYILVEPPTYVRVKGNGTTKGWIHY